MSDFFVLTERSAAGPFTGVELREAAMAGMVRHDAIIGSAAEGPWYKASDVGLFSQEKTPLPHPPATAVPQYQVRGVHGAIHGPFNLRDLIGFAARGMLPANALLQSDQSDEWIAAGRIHILASCINGDLLRIMVVAESSDASDTAGGRAPDSGDTTSFAAGVSRAEEEPESVENLAANNESSLSDQDSVKSPNSRSRLRTRVQVRQRISWFRISIRRRLAIQLACVALVFAGVASAFTFWNQMATRRDHIIGDWISMLSVDNAPIKGPAFGISFQEDGRLVVFNAKGDSWTGTFEWSERVGDHAAFDDIEPFSTVVVDKVAALHETGIIEPTDGYIRLRGSEKQSPTIDGHPVRDLFLRRDGDQLHIGYLASLHWTQDSKSMKAGWLATTRSRISRPDITADLRTIEKHTVPTGQFGGEIPLHLSEAIDAVRTGIPSNVGGTPTTLHECLAYSSMFTSKYLLENYGLPDEARRIDDFEIPQLRSGPSFEGSQVVRYGDLKFIFSTDGQLQYLVLVTQL